MTDRAALSLKMYKSARAAEKLAPEAFDRHFGRQRAMLVSHAARTSPFYSERLNDLRHLDDARIDPASWLKIPLLSRSELRENLDTIKSTDVPAHHGDIRLGRTSGTSGMPVEILRTAMHELADVAVIMRYYAWNRLDARRNFVFITGDVVGPYPDGEKLETEWMDPYLRDGPCGYTIRLRHPIEPAKQIEFLSRQGPCYLATQPSNALAIAMTLQQMGADAPRLDVGMVLTLGELVRESHRKAVRDRLGCGITDVYSAREIGVIACQCASQKLHVAVDTMHVEILRRDGSPAAPGEEGRIVVTCHSNWATPLIRYDTGDIGKFGEPCSCGVTLPVLELSVGRDRNLFRFSDGSTVLGMIGLEKFREFFPAIQWQVAQTGAEQLEIRYYSRQPDEAHDFARVKSEVEAYFGRPLAIAFKRLDKMPHGRTGKLSEAVREIE